MYINKNPKDTIPIKYTTVKDVKDTIRKLERLYKAKKYPHTRIWKVGMILKVRLEAMVKHTGKKKIHFKHSKNYFHFLGQRTTKEESERRKMVFKFNKTYRKRKSKFGSNSYDSELAESDYEVLYEDYSNVFDGLPFSQQVEIIKDNLIKKKNETESYTTEREYSPIPYMSNPNDKIEVTNDGRLFFSNGLEKAEGNINITIRQDDKYYLPTESQEKTFEIKNRKDILPYPLDTFLQAFKESNDKMGKLIIAIYIILLSNKKFPYNTYKYQKTMRDVKKLVSYYHPSFKFGREVAKRTNEKLWRRIPTKVL